MCILDSGRKKTGLVLQRLESQNNGRNILYIQEHLVESTIGSELLVAPHLTVQAGQALGRLTGLAAAERTRRGELDTLCSVTSSLLGDCGAGAARTLCLSSLASKTGSLSTCAGLLCSFPKSLEQRFCRLGSQILVVVVVDLDHRGVGACAQTFDFGKGEKLVLGSLAVVNLELLLDSLHNTIRSSELAGSLLEISFDIREESRGGGRTVVQH